MPCPTCHAPDLQNAQANFCFHCGTALTSAVQKEKTTTDKRALTLFVILAGIDALASIYYYILPRVFTRFLGSDSLNIFYRTSSLFFLIIDIALLILCAVFIRQTGLKVMLFVICFFRIILGIVYQFNW